jgi:inorganic pyrophosphatase
MNDYNALPPWSEDGQFHVVVEAPAGSRVKYKYEPSLKGFTVSRPLAAGVAYPYDWGFIPGTCAEDGDPLDAMVLSSVPSYPGVVHVCRPLGVVRLTQKTKGGDRERNDRVIAAPRYCCALADEEVDDLTKNLRAELEQFFVSAVLFEDKQVRIEGWDGPKAALKLIRRAQRAPAKT